MASTSEIKPETLPPTSYHEDVKLGPIGLRKLDTDRIETYFFPRRPAEEKPISLLRLIQSVIRAANVLRENVAKNRHHPLRKIERIQITWDPKEHAGFDCASYRIRNEGTAPIGKAHKELDARESFKQIRFACFSFFFKEELREIYALTRSNTWMIIRRYTDYKWPGLFCRHFLNPARVIKVTRESIFGLERREEISYPRGQRLELLEARDRLYTELVMPFRDDSSIYTLPQFQTSSSKKFSRDTNVEVQVGQIRIQKKLCFSAFPIVLDHITKRLNKHILPRVNEQFEILDYLIKVEDQDRRAQLTNHVLDRIGESIKNSTPCGYSLCHKYVNDFLSSPAEFLTVKYKKNRFQVGRFATLNDVLDVLRLRMPDLSHHSKIEIRKELNNVKISYDSSGNGGDLLIDFVEGEIRDQTGAYFRINKCFYRLSGDYLALVGRDFRRSLANLIIRDGPGYLPLSWGGTKRDGHLTAKAVGGKDKLTKLANKKVCYLDLKKVQAIPKFRVLKGEILTHVGVRTHRSAIEELLRNRKTLKKDVIEKKLKINQQATQEIWIELTKKRSIIKKEKDKHYVINPLVDDTKLSEKLSAHCFDYYAREKEGPYNERYLDKKKFIVGDRVLPFGIEIFDILKITRSTTYIYHVKEGFDLHTRDALDQLMNAVEMIYEARYAASKSNVLEEWYRLATNPTNVKAEDQAYRKKLAKKLENKKITFDTFKSYFFDRKLVYVYAVLDHHAQECTFEKEMKLKEKFSIDDFKGMIKQTKKVKVTAQNIFKALQKNRFLDSKGRIDCRLESKESFIKEFPLDISEAAKGRIYKEMKDQASQFNSTIALLTLRRARRHLAKFNVDFKICQIKRSEYQADQPFEIPKYYDFIDEMPKEKEMQINISYEGVSLKQKQSTRGDGACALHALLGNQIVNGQLAYVVGDAIGPEVGNRAKQDYLNQIKEQHVNFQEDFINCMIEFVEKDKELSEFQKAHLSQCEKKVSLALKNLDDVYQDVIKQEEIFAQIAPSLKETKDEYQEMEDTQLKELFENDAQTCVDAFAGALDDILPKIIDCDKFQQGYQIYLQAKGYRTQEEHNYLLSKELFDIYQNRVLDPDYYLSDIEIKLAAHLYDKKVVLFSEDQDPQVFNDLGKEVVYIRHDGDHLMGHYTRLSADNPQEELDEF